MSVEIKEATLRDMCWIGANLREHDRREVFATARLESGTQAGAMSFLTSPGFAWTAWIDDQPVAAFGVSQGNPQYQPHLRYGWLYGRDQTRRCIPAITRFCLTEWPKRLISEGVTRVEVRSLDGHDLADKWLRSCRAHHEAKMKNYGINGEDFNLYAWLADDWKDQL